MTQTVETTGPAARVRLTADRPRIAADGEDVCIVTAAVVDESGRVVPIADHELGFSALYGAQQFEINDGGTESDPNNADGTRAKLVPNVNYQYLRLGADFTTFAAAVDRFAVTPAT